MYELLLAEVEAGRAPANVNARDLKRAIYEAESHTETILRLYYLRHGFEKGDMMLVHFIVRFAFSSLAKLEALAPAHVLASPSPGASTAPEPPSPPAPAKEAGAFDLEDIRAALVLAERGLSDQGRSFYFPQTLFHVIQSRLGPEESRIVLQHAGVPEEDFETRQKRAMHILSSYPVRDNTADAPLGEYMSKYADEDRSSRESS